MTAVLQGKRVLITGAAAGFGRATAELFAAEGALVTGMDLRWHEDVLGIRRVDGDVTNDSDVKAAVEEAAAGQGLDVLIANAGMVLIDDLRTANPADWCRLLDVNVVGVMRCFQAAADNMIANGRRGKLLATGSIAGMRPYAAGSSYCASKAAVHALVKAAALSFGDAGITVNAVAPGSAKTEMFVNAMASIADQTGKSLDDTIDEVASSVPLGRLAETDDIAKLFLFLASSQSDFINGVTIACDGGSVL